MFCLSRIWITNCTCAVKIDLVWPKHLGRIDTRSWRCYAVLHELHVTKLNIKPMVGTCRKRTISAPELETSRRERWEQNLAKEIRKQQKIFYQPHIYVKNVGPCNFLCLFPCSPTYLMFPCSLRFFGLFPCSHCQISRFPLFPKNPWGTLGVLYLPYYAWIWLWPTFCYRPQNPCKLYLNNILLLSS